MRILIQNCKSGAFLASDGQWSTDPELARDFESSRQAVSFCVRQACEDVQIVLKFTRDDLDVTLPVSTSCKDGAAFSEAKP